MLKLLALATSLISIAWAQAREPRDRPNLVILFCDDAGYGDFSHNGHPTIQTPHLSRLAQEGMNFTQFYSASPVCSASRYGLLTGRHPFRSGFPSVLFPRSKEHLASEEQTIAELASSKGYKSAIIGKWHLGYPNKNNAFTPEALPLAHGFNYWFGLPYSNDMKPPRNPDLELVRGPSLKQGSTGPIPGYETVTSNPDQNTLTDLYTAEATKFISANKDTPFLLYVPYAMPHIPLAVGKEAKGKSRRGEYGDVIQEIDDSVGKILEQLRLEGLDQNTLIIFTSDNGPWLSFGLKGGSAGLFRDGKGSTWEGGMRVPGVFRWTGVIPAGIRNESPASLLDLVPTFAELSGAKLGDQKLDGRSLAPLFAGEELPPENFTFFYGQRGNDEPVAVRKGAWKLHLKITPKNNKHPFGKVSRESPLLFNLETDPSETLNLAKKQPEKVTELLKEIDRFIQEVEVKP